MKRLYTIRLTRTCRSWITTCSIKAAEFAVLFGGPDEYVGLFSEPYEGEDILNVVAI